MLWPYRRGPKAHLLFFWCECSVISEGKNDTQKSDKTTQLEVLPNVALKHPWSLIRIFMHFPQPGKATTMPQPAAQPEALKRWNRWFLWVVDGLCWLLLVVVGSCCLFVWLLVVVCLVVWFLIVSMFGCLVGRCEANTHPTRVFLHKLFINMLNLTVSFYIKISTRELLSQVEDAAPAGSPAVSPFVDLVWHRLGRVTWHNRTKMWHV